MMGSGGMIVMDEDTCMVDFARYFLNFLRDESCGKCTTCREGLKRMWELTNDVCEGRGAAEHIERLERLAEVVAEGSLCALGQTAPNPVLSTLRYFRDEYAAHIEERICPAKVCKALIHFHILGDKCTGCDLCRIRCPHHAISGEKKKGDTYEIHQDPCTKCRICYQSCKFGAIEIRTGPLVA
jgi:ferredoxin